VLKFLGEKKFLLEYLCLADFNLYEFLSVSYELFYEELETLGETQRVSRFLKNFESIPEIKNYIETSPYYVHRPFFVA